MKAVQEHVIDGALILDGEFSDGVGIGSTNLLKVLPLSGNYLLCKGQSSVLLICRKYAGKKFKNLKFYEKTFSRRICSSYRTDINSKVSQDVEPYVVLFDSDMNEMFRFTIPDSDDANLGLKLEIAKMYRRVVAIRISKRTNATTVMDLSQPLLEDIEYEPYMPISGFKMLKPKLNTLSFFDADGVLQKCDVASVEDILNLLEKYPKLEKHIRQDKRGNYFAVGCNAYTHNNERQRLSGDALKTLKAVVSSLSEGVTVEDFQNALREHDKQMQEANPLERRLSSTSAKRYWVNNSEKCYHLHSVLVELCFNGSIKDINAFLSKNEDMLVFLGKEAIRKEDFPDVDVEKLKMSRLIAWPTGIVSINFIPG